MKKLLFVAMFLTLTYIQSKGQGKYFTRTGTISFFSKTSMENIEAVNNQASSIFDSGTGEIEGICTPVASAFGATG